MSSSPIPSFLVSNVSKSLRVLTKNERPWAIRSGPSEKMSNCEQITQVAHQKWAQRNEQLWANRSGRSGRSPKMSKWVNCSFFEQIAHSHIFVQETSNSLGKPMSKFPALVYYVCLLCLFLMFVYFVYFMFVYYVCLLCLFNKFVY